ncbi:MAG: hypothetical protein IKF19_06365 [Bacilli bacterium]|nr:hypothetical protein [Bacilli bacterium]
MKIDIKDILALNDNNEYVVTSIVNYDNKTYYYLVDIKNTSNIKFCYRENDELIEIENKKLITKLLPMFFETAKNVIENIN